MEVKNLVIERSLNLMLKNVNILPLESKNKIKENL